MNHRAPIEWSPDSRTVERILVFCQRDVSFLRQKLTNKSYSKRDLEARIAILERIYGNLCNVNRRAYPSEVSFSTVEMDLTRGLNDTVEGRSLRTQYIESLELEWANLRNYFRKNFPVRHPD